MWFCTHGTRPDTSGLVSLVKDSVVLFFLKITFFIKHYQNKEGIQ